MSQTSHARMPATTSLPVRLLTVALTAVVGSLVGAPGVRAETRMIPHSESIRIDGDASDWATAGYEVSVVDRIKRNVSTSQLSGEVTLRLAWNDEGLLVYTRVLDADRFEEKSSFHRADSVEWFLAGAVGASRSLQSIIAPGIAGGAHTSPRSRLHVHGDLPKPAPDAVSVAGGPTADGYWLEALIPWKHAGVTASEGATIGFQQIVNDRDAAAPETGDAEQRHAIDSLCFFPDRETYRNSLFMHGLRLARVASPAANIRSELRMSPQGAHIEVAGASAWSGKRLRVLQGANTLGETVFERDDTTRLARARVALTGLASQGGALRVTVEARPTAEVLLYGELAAPAAQTLRKLLSTANDAERFILLQQFRDATRADAAVQADIETLLPIVELWARGRELAASGRLADPQTYLNSAVTAAYPPEIRRDSPLYPLYCLFRGRNLVWTVVQVSQLHGSAIKPEGHYSIARKLFAEAQAIVPDNPIINMYLGKPIPWDDVKPDDQAPDWANAQRVVLNHLSDIVRFWVNERQMPGGGFGGGWGDDVEMWRNWLPVLLAFEDPVAIKAQELLANGLFAQPHVANVYSSVLTDVERAFEDSADTLTPMLYLKPESGLWRDRAMKLADYMTNTWTGTNERGELMFKSILFNHEWVSPNPLQAYDTTLNTRAIQPLLVHWLQTGDPKLTPLITRWLDTWIAATADTRDGKPAGIVPAALHWPTGRIGGASGQWWKTEAFSDLHDWPSHVSDMLHTFLVAYQITGDEKYLGPVRSMARIRLDYLEKAARDAGRKLSEMSSDTVLDDTREFGNAKAEPQPAGKAHALGSLEWAASRLGPILAGALNTHRRLTGDTTFDAVVLHDGGGYGRWLVQQDEKALTAGLARSAEAFSVNRAAYTSEVRWTDRAFRLTAAYLNTYAKTKLPLPDTSLVYSVVTGDPSAWQGGRFAAVRWLTEPRDFAALVKLPSSRGFEAKVYHFGQAPRRMGAESLLLAPGRYEFVLLNDMDEEEFSFKFVSDGRAPNQHFFEVPARTLCTIRVTPAAE